ncbi:RagB/SusD family nutrient uptake outer membrane protein [Flammeovirga sp. SR4]|uniref:RagB/SusD family nutrient uptake outer membrane protein n=2 Tax=Flammeovirga agarivorans TaxID=2726742 RepID=A0A7X8SN71_9BACT|nr:RagB/SusD family nutrient uptake outer membrane protein [Flammeovirga agarivorans]
MLKSMNYKNIVFCLLMLGGVSCNFLEEDPKGYITENDLPQTYEGALSLAMAPYENWVSGGNLFGRWFYLWELGTDDMSSQERPEISGPNANYLLHTANPDEYFYYNGIWGPLWKGVADCNNAMDKIQKMDGEITDEEKEEIIGELKTNRALYYYFLVRMFGDLPKVTQPMNLLSNLGEIPRSDAMEIYNEIIIPDLKDAIEVLPESYGTSYAGRFTKTSANVLLAEVYLTMAGWRYTSAGQLLKGDSELYRYAMAYADSAINNNGGFEIFTENEEYENPFEQPWRQHFSKESLIEFGNLSGLGKGAQAEGLQLVAETMDHGAGKFWGGNPKKFHGSATGMYIPTPDLFRAFEEGDKRKDFSMLVKAVDAKGDTCYSPPIYHKLCDPFIYRGEPGFQAADGDINIVLYRIADALLIFAEASNEVNGPTAKAVEQINKLRRRGGLTDLSTSMTKDQFREIIWKERRVETNGEGKRKFDLVRTNRLKQLADARDIYYSSSDNPEYANGQKDDILINTICLPYPQHEYIWPIPRPDMLLHDNWKQNYGY